MTALEKLDKIKKLLFGEAAPADPNAGGQTLPLTDGTTITFVPNLAQGATATIAGQPAPDGEYPMPDGSTVVVAGGVVASIEAASTESAEGDPGVDMATEHMNTLKEWVSQLISKFKSEELEPLKQENESLKAKFEAQTQGIGQLVELVGEMAKEPSAAPTENRPAAFKKESKEDKITQLADNLMKLRNEANK